MYRFYDLEPQKGQKSFYGKAKIFEHMNGEIYLISYKTRVCKIDKNGKFLRLWGGYSATTMRHINSFIEMFGIPGGGKAWWISLPLPYEPHDSGGAWLTPAESLKAMYARRAMNF